MKDEFNSVLTRPIVSQGAHGHRDLRPAVLATPGDPPGPAGR